MFREYFFCFCFWAISSSGQASYSLLVILWQQSRAFEKLLRIKHATQVSYPLYYFSSSLSRSISIKEKDRMLSLLHVWVLSCVPITWGIHWSLSFGEETAIPRWNLLVLVYLFFFFFEYLQYFPEESVSRGSNDNAVGKVLYITWGQLRIDSWHHIRSPEHHQVIPGGWRDSTVSKAYALHEADLSFWSLKHCQE